ncbi:hypothetical protein RHS01_09764 [Rhizoctonia solani]|nr:hypothetical protein RHS01_09764 [Rhizoctonia solani]
MIVPKILLHDVVYSNKQPPVPDVPHKEQEEGEEDTVCADVQVQDEALGLNRDPDMSMEELLFDTSMELQGGYVMESCTTSLCPDFGIAQAHSKLFTNQNHLYVEIKDRECPSCYFKTQLIDYANTIANTIPSDFGNYDVVLMLINAANMHFCHIRPGSWFNIKNTWTLANSGKTHSPKMNAILQEIANRV